MSIILQQFFFKILDNPEITDYMKEDRRSYTHNFCSCEKKKAWKNSGLYGIRILDQCDTGAGGALQI